MPVWWVGGAAIVSAIGSAITGRNSAKRARAAKTQSAMINAINANADSMIAKINSELAYAEGMTNADIARLQGKADAFAMATEYNRSSANDLMVSIAQGRSGGSVDAFARAAEYQYEWDLDFVKMNSEIQAIGHETAAYAGQAQYNIQGIQIQSEVQAADTSQFYGASTRSLLSGINTGMNVFQGGMAVAGAIGGGSTKTAVRYGPGEG